MYIINESGEILKQLGLSANFVIIILLLVIVYYLHLINNNLSMEYFSIGGQEGYPAGALRSACER